MDFTYEGIALIPIVMILVRVVKITGIPKNFYPLVSIILGVIFGVVFLEHGDIRKGILSGIIIGISASGLYSNGKEMSEFMRSGK